MPVKYTEARKRANIKYIKEKTDDIRLRVPKGTKEAWKDASEKFGAASMTQYVVKAVEEQIKRDEEKQEAN